MSERVKALIKFSNIGFNRLEMTTKDLTEGQLDIKSCPEASTIRWILTHLTEILHIFVPKVITGNKEYTPEGWTEDYTGNPSYSLEKILGDLESSKAEYLERLEKIEISLLDEPLDWFYGVQPREVYLMLAVSEIHHHEGQIAAILGIEKRMGGLH
jgi:hypothetical protein